MRLRVTVIERTVIKIMLARLFVLSLFLASPWAQGAVDFNREIRPLLSDRCFSCHGPDANKRESGLRLDTPEGAVAKLKSGKRAVVPGKPQESELVARIKHTDPEEQMPPAKLHRPLTKSEQSLLSQWIAEGAVYARHWAFEAPQKSASPATKNPAWARDELDHFILAKLDQEGLQPNPEADRATWLRRAAFAITGLPPSPEQLAAFQDDKDPKTFEKQADALLASPRYGEHMALEWLDLARFADTYGYQSDKECFVWPWRDWVIKAFNENLSYDQFLTWQLAGDLLPNASLDQRLATMFNRLHRQTEEGGSIEQEFRQEYISDRVHTAGTTFLGLTLECSKCHDHKYDPLPQADYYSLCAMFGNIDECGLTPYSINTKAPEPSLRLVEPAAEAEHKQLSEALAAAITAHQKNLQTRDAKFSQWLAATPALSSPTPKHHLTLDALEGGKLPNAISGGAAGTVSGGQLKPAPGAVAGAMEFDGDTLLLVNGVKGIDRHQQLTVSLYLNTPEKKNRAVIFHTGPGLYSQGADAGGFELLMENGKLHWSCIHLWPGCAASIETQDDFPIAKWVQVTVTYDGSSSAGGMKIYHDGKPVPTVVLHDQLDKSISTEVMRVAARPRDDRGFAQGKIDDIKVFGEALSSLEVADLFKPVIEQAFTAAKSGQSASKAMVRDHYLTRVDPEITKTHGAIITAKRALEDTFLKRFPLVMTMKESPRPRKFHVLTRGDYTTPDLKRPVEASAPAAVLPYGAKLPKNRLGLAQWMTDKKHPLVSRVAVNRMWIACFGSGIVATQENFGLQGDSPSHQSLLDSLAVDFSTTGWDMKKMLKRIILSATFRQSSANMPEKRTKDPKNQWFSRGPAYRLSGEAIRDQALLASGLLVEKLGGPSAMPWQPEGIWSDAGATGSYKPDSGEGLYRRSVYTFRKRTAPPPNMLTLDSGSREVCLPRRLTTNTPLQPLVFLNDKSFFECAKFLAKRVVSERANDVPGQLQRAFLLLTSRVPAAEELKALQELHDRQVTAYTADKPAAKSLCGEENPALAAMTVVCSTLLASDAALTTR